MMRRHLPPARRSISRMVVVKPFGPHHCPTCQGSANAPQTIARGAINSREKTISFAAAASIALLVVSTMNLLLVVRLNAFQFACVFLFRFCLQPVQVVFEAVEALFPELAVLVE